MIDTKKRLASRAALLGAAGALALSGAIAGGIVGPHAAYADAQTQTQSSDSNNRVLTVNPTSFADVVEHVRNAVVSVKVKMTESAAENGEGEGDGDGPQMPQLKPGDPAGALLQAVRPARQQGASAEAEDDTGPRVGLLHHRRRNTWSRTITWSSMPPTFSSSRMTARPCPPR